MSTKECRFFSDQLMLELRQELEKRGLVTVEQVGELDSRQTLTGSTLAKLVVEESLVGEDDVLSILSELTHIPYRHLADLDVDPGIASAIQSRVALRYRILPVAQNDGTITIATSAVPDMATVDGLRMLLDRTIDWVLCTEIDIRKSLTHFYGLGAETLDGLIEVPEDQEAEPAATHDLKTSSNIGIVRFINQVIAEAIEMEATDIHIEPFEESLRLRYRIDGILQEIPLPKGISRIGRSVSSAVKIMADMDIAERRKPHDGRIKVKLRDSEYDLRVSVLPSGHGETVNMRILSRNSSFVNLENLGLSESQMPQIENLTSLPHGVVLLTGPTGSGKTTTLYALLARVSHVGIKIITVEDPIEYQMKGISQIQTHASIGLTFASILRSILRHDPDVILIGEIRDAETADIAVRASLTGHLVFSTLHTNDAPSAVTRLADMGAEPYLISSCLEGAVAQRLVRRVCGSCAEPRQPDPVIYEEIARSYPSRMQDATFLAGTGCPDCNFTGYHGRCALIEIMTMSKVIRELIMANKPANEIKEVAIANGMTTLRNDGWEKVLRGITTVDEVMRVARKSEM